MKIEVMEKWVEALESEEYKQGTARLRTNDRYCCLGVLCEIAKKEGVIENYPENGCFLPLEVQIWADMRTSCGGFFFDKGNATYLTKLNDGAENTIVKIKTKDGDVSVRYLNALSFEDIAKIIKEYYKEL